MAASTGASRSRTPEAGSPVGRSRWFFPQGLRARMEAWCRRRLTMSRGGAGTKGEEALGPKVAPLQPSASWWQETQEGTDRLTALGGCPPSSSHQRKGGTAPPRESLSTEQQPSWMPSRNLHEEVEAVRRRLRGRSIAILDPAQKAVRYWEMTMVAAIAVTAIFVPVQVAFLENTYDAHFCLGSALDVCFLADVVLHFFVAYPDESRGNILIKDRRRIARRYAGTWFAFDLLSTLPFSAMLHVAVRGRDRLKGPQRVLRLLKLLRVVRLGRMRSRSEVFAASSVSFAELRAYKMVALLLTFAHWLASVWGLIAHEEIIGDGTYSWIVARREKMRDHEGRPLFRTGSARDRYAAALYFSIYSMAGIGYGDITPSTSLETWVCSLFMASGALFWAFMIGSFCGVVYSMNGRDDEYHQRIDMLNRMMRERDFPEDLRRRCRLFVVNSKNLLKAAGYAKLESSFSFGLRGEVAACSNEAWMKSVWYLRESSKDFIIEVSQSLTALMFAPMEPIDIALSLVVLNSGIAAKKGRILSRGAILCKEFCIENIGLVDQTIAAALSYAHVTALAREDFLRIVADPIFEREREIVMKASRFYTLKMSMVKVAAHINAQRKAALGVVDPLDRTQRPREFTPTELIARSRRASVAMAGADPTQAVRAMTLLQSDANLSFKSAVRKNSLSDSRMGAAFPPKQSSHGGKSAKKYRRRRSDDTAADDDDAEKNNDDDDDDAENCNDDDDVTSPLSIMRSTSGEKKTKHSEKRLEKNASSSTAGAPVVENAADARPLQSPIGLPPIGAPPANFARDNASPGAADQPQRRLSGSSLQHPHRRLSASLQQPQRRASSSSISTSPTPQAATDPVIVTTILAAVDRLDRRIGLLSEQVQDLRRQGQQGAQGGDDSTLKRRWRFSLHAGDELRPLRGASSRDSM